MCFNNSKHITRLNFYSNRQITKRKFDMAKEVYSQRIMAGKNARQSRNDNGKLTPVKRS